MERPNHKGMGTGMKKLFVIGLWATLLLSMVLDHHPLQAASLTQVIEEAKKERSVSARLRVGIVPKSIARLESEIKEKFGVNLKINFTPSSGSFPKDLAEAIMEHKAGAPPSYDLMTFGPEHIVDGIRAGIFEKVEWSALLPREVSPEVIVNIPRFGEVGLSYYTSQGGLMYNPKKVTADEVPRSLSALGNPKWKGQVGILNYTATWATRAFILGKDKVLSDLRAVLKNGAIQGPYPDLYNRYLLGEISIAFIGNSYVPMALNKGVPAAWQNLDYVDEESRPCVVRKGTQRPNAARLFAIYLAGPQGAKFMLEETGAGNACYPGNFTYDIRMQGKNQGMKIISRDALMDFFESAEFTKWEKEIKLVFASGGGR